MSSRLSRILLVLISLAVARAAAEAQIYTWHDGKGTLVLSDRPLDPQAETFDVAHARAVRTTRQPAGSQHADAYDGLIREHAARYGVRADLVRAVVQVESGFNPRAVSPKGAIGLMQLMPATAEEFGVANAFNPAQNIRGGVAYLRSLLSRYEGNEELALAAYNAGPVAVERYGNRVPPYRETRDYVRRITQTTTPRSGSVVYKSIEIINGRAVPRYSNVPPPSGEYEIAEISR